MKIAKVTTPGFDNYGSYALMLSFRSLFQRFRGL